MNVPQLNAKTVRGDDRPSERDSRPTCVYGDSTPFPHEGTFIDAIRHAVDCGVSLMAAQNAIVRAGARLGEVERARQSERAKLESMHQTVHRTVTADAAAGAERLQRTGARILDAARLAVEASIVQLEAMAAEEMAKARSSKEEARIAALRAVEKFLLHHDLPGTHVGLRMLATEQGYAANALVAAPFGVEAIFTLLVPDAHEWGRLRQVRDLATGVEVHIPLESGLIWKKVEVQGARLDKLFIASVHMSATRSVIVLRRQPNAGAGYKIDIDAATARTSTRVLLHKLLEDGMESAEVPIDLVGDDAAHVIRLWQRIVDSASDLMKRRTVITSALVDGRKMQDLDEPQLVCERLIGVLGPVVREIAKRSGAPGELVLRRDIRAGRRDEVYITKAELYEKLLVLPAAMRAVFDPFELDAERSPRAPAASFHDSGELAELSEADVEILGTRSPPLLPPARTSTRPPPRVS